MLLVSVTLFVCCELLLLLVLEFKIIEELLSEVCNLDNASKASGKFGGVAGVLVGATI